MFSLIKKSVILLTKLEEFSVPLILFALDYWDLIISSMPIFAYNYEFVWLSDLGA